MTHRLTTQEALHALFNPRAVAVIGASEDTTKHGRIVLDNIGAVGFAGRIVAVNRRLDRLGDVACYADLAAAPEPVDVAFLAIPAEAAIASIREGGRAGLKVAIVGSAGYAESLDADGAARQVELARAAAEAGVRLVGPNCNGVYNTAAALSIGFNTSHAKRLPPGAVAIFSHSGALFDAMAGRLTMLGAGLSLFASAGNEADLSVLDYMEYGIAHAPTRVIALLIDSLPDGARFRALAAAAQSAGKHVVALKIGASERGASAAVAHSSRLAGDAAAYAALFVACGVPTADTLEGLMTASALLARYGRRAGGLGALSTSGAGASLIADRCAARGIALADLGPGTLGEIERWRVFSRIGNPLDLGIFGGMARARPVPVAMARDEGVGALLALVHSLNPWQGEPVRAALFEAAAQTGKPLLLLSPGGMPDEEHALYAAQGIPVFTDTDIVLEGLRAMLAPTAPVTPPFPEDPLPDGVAGLPSGTLTEPDSLRLLRAFGIPAVPTTECADHDAAQRAAAAIGFPVVAKGVVPGVSHKSDSGLVHVDIADAAALERALGAIAVPRVIIQRMIRGEVEAIAGLSRSPGVGVVLLAGLGGIYAEALDDVTIWPVPVSAERIRADLLRSSLGRILSSPRWRHPDVLPALVEVLLGLQRLALALGERVEAVDVNPLVLGVHGVLAVDALAVLRETSLLA